MSVLKIFFTFFKNAKGSKFTAIQDKEIDLKPDKFKKIFVLFVHKRWTMEKA